MAFDTRRWSNVHTISSDFNPYEGYCLRIEHDCGKIIEFKDSKHLCGDFTLLKATYIKYDNSQEAFQKKIGSLNENIKLRAVLNFSLKYIFGVDISTGSPVSEMFTKQKNAAKGYTGRSIVLDQWSSGYFSILGLLLDFCKDNRVVCIDEPELHLEPRTLRKLMDILIWRCNPDARMEKEWGDWFESMAGKDNKAWENGNKLEPLENKQIFIASHSPILINEFFSRENCSIYEFDKEYQDSSYQTRTEIPTPVDVENDSLVSVVREISLGDFPHSILDNLGARGSDLLQTNGIIWVEGPSDVIYIKKWLEMYAKESEKPILKQGIDYEFQMFGGALLDSLCLIKEGSSEEEERKKLVSMFSFSRNAFVVTDSDAIKNDNREIVDQSNFLVFTFISPYGLI